MRVRMLCALLLATTLAGAQTFQASSSQRDDMNAGQAFDGDPTTRWSARYSEKDRGWIQATWDEPRMFRGVEINCGTPGLKGAPRDLAILIRNGDEWKVLKSLANNKQGMVKIGFPPTTAKEWRIRIDAVVDRSWAPTVLEIGFISDDSPPSAETTQELPVCRSSPPGLAGREAALAVDGNDRTRFEAAKVTDKSWIEVTWPEPMEFNALQLVVRAEGGFGVPEKFRVQARKGSRWATVARISDSFTSRPAHRFKRTKAARWRVEVEKIVNPKGALRINEIRFALVSESDSWPQTTPTTVRQKDVNAAIDRSVKWLQSQRLANGNWKTPHTTEYPMGVMALVGMALRKSGLERDDGVLLDIVNRLESLPLRKTYGVSVYAQFLGSLSSTRYRARLEECAGFLVDNQAPDGLWGYPDGRSDLSCAQFALLGLDAAAAAGVQVPSRVFEKSWDWMLGGGKKDGGFNYCPHGARASDPATGSMTAAALACIRICDRRLKRDGGRRRRSTKVIANGIDWMGSRFVVEMNPGSSQSHYYWLYGVERVGAFFNIRKIGDHAWYPTGARHLLDWQWSDGSWHRNVEDTCFALLFLNRASVTSK